MTALIRDITNVMDAVSVKQYGAKNDGVTPTAAIIQNAINNTSIGDLYVPDGIYLLETALQLRDNLNLICSKNSKFIPASNGMTMIQAATHAYFSQVRNARIDGNGMTGITGFDLASFRLQAGLYDCYVTNMQNGAVMRSGCFGTTLQNFTSYNGVPNPITVVENCAVLDIINPRLDNETGTGNGTGNGIYVQGAGIPNEGVRVTGGYIQGFQYGVQDSGLGTRINEPYFEQCSAADAFFNGARNSSIRDCQHFASIGAAAYKGRNSDAITILNPNMGSGARTVLYDFDSSNTNCNEYRPGSNASYNTPVGSLTYLSSIARQVISTFVPTIAGSSTSGTATYSLQSAMVVQMGNQIQIQIGLTWSGHTGTGNVLVLGIPAGLAPSSYSPRRFGLAEPSGALAFSGPLLGAYFNGSGTQVALIQTSASGNETLVPLTASGSLQLNLNYSI